MKNKSKKTDKDELVAAISMALHQELFEAHDYEDMRLTIKRVSTQWNMHTLMMHDVPVLHKNIHK